MKPRIGVSFWNDWPDLIDRGNNWNNFTLIKLTFEWSGKDGYKGRYIEIEVGLFGLNFDLEIYGKESRDIALEPILKMKEEYEKDEAEEL